MRRLVVVCLCVAASLAGCRSRSGDEANETPGAAREAEATPMVDISLDVSLIQPENLGLELGVASHANPLIWPLRGVPNGDNHFSQQMVDASGEYVGWVSIFLFNSLQSVDEAFALVEANVAGNEAGGVPAVGERSIVYDEDGRHGIALVQCTRWSMSSPAGAMPCPTWRAMPASWPNAFLRGSAPDPRQRPNDAMAGRGAIADGRLGANPVERTTSNGCHSAGSRPSLPG